MPQFTVIVDNVSTLIGSNVGGLVHNASNKAKTDPNLTWDATTGLAVGKDVICFLYATSSTGPALKFYKYRGTSSAPTAVASGDQLCVITGRGYDGVSIDYVSSPAALFMFAAEAFTATAHGTYLTIGTTPVGTVSRLERLRVTDSGNIGIGTLAPAFQLDINHATGQCLSLIYDDSNGSPANHVDFTVGATGDLTITPSGGDVSIVGNLTLSAKNIITDTTTGMQIGTAAAQKLGFYGATPVIQRAKASYANWAALANVVQALVDIGLFDAA